MARRIDETKLVGGKDLLPIGAKPIGALVMSAFAEVHAPFAKVDDARKEVDLDVPIDPPTLGEAMAFVLKEIDTTFSDEIARDRLAFLKANPKVEGFSWDSKRVGKWEWVVYRVAVVGAKEGRLAQPNVFRVWVDTEKEVVEIEVIDKDAFSYGDLRARLDQVLVGWSKMINAQRLRNAYAYLREKVYAIPFMPQGTGGVSFVPIEGLPKIEKFRAFLEKMGEFKVTSNDLDLRWMEVYDRASVVEGIRKDAEKEVNRRLDELAEMAAQDVLEAKDSNRLEKLLERRLAAREKAFGIKSTYEDLLNAKVALRDRIVAPKLLQEATKRLEGLEGREALSPRARALFSSIFEANEAREKKASARLATKGASA